MSASDTDKRYHAYLFQKRWPNGFCAERTGTVKPWRLGRRNIYQCAPCGQQQYLLKSTIVQQSKTVEHAVQLPSTTYPHPDRRVSLTVLES